MNLLLQRVFFLMIIICIVGVTCVHAGFWTGNDLIDGWRIVHKMIRGDQGKIKNEELIELGRYSGYVIGVVDATQNLYNLPAGFQLNQALEIVGKYIDSHPETRSKPGAELVVTAMREAFPFSK